MSCKTRVNAGDFVQSLSTEKKLRWSVSNPVLMDLSFSEPRAMRRIWKVVAILSVQCNKSVSLYENQTTFALVLPCNPIRDRVYTISRESSARVIIPLTSGVRRTMAVSQCERMWSNPLQRSDSEYCNEASCEICTSGGVFNVVGHSEGYPPRSA